MSKGIVLPPGMEHAAAQAAAMEQASANAQVQAVLLRLDCAAKFLAHADVLSDDEGCWEESVESSLKLADMLLRKGGIITVQRNSGN